MARVLVADNSPFYRRLLHDELVRRGHSVQTVPDGLMALRQLEEQPADAVILDLLMPRVSGDRACRQIKSNPATAAIPVIILSGIREDEIDDPEGMGADVFVAKMVASQMLDHLGSALDDVLAGRNAPDQTMRGFDGMHRREVVSELLEESRSREVLLRSLREGYLRVADSGRVIEANPAALRMLGRPEGDVVNRPAWQVLGCAEPAFREMREGSGEVRLSLGEREIVARGRGEATAGADEERYLLLLDVTDEARAHRERRDLEARVEASERMSALGQILAGVAHELNKPLTGILGYAELVLRLSEDDRTRSRLEKLNQEALRCRRIVENLLCFARQRHSYRRSHSLNALVEKTVAVHELAVQQAGAVIETDLAADLPGGRFDLAQMEQVLSNLIINACQAMAGRSEPAGRIRVRTRRQEERLILEVEDNGAGIEEAHRQRVFEPFFTTHRTDGGTGLGLAVSYGIIQEHGGTIQVHDAAPGTIMRIELPLTAGPEAAADKDAAVVGDGTRASVLVVDDEPVVLDLIEDVLTDQGLHVRRAENGARALELLEAGHVDAMLIDIKMPGMDGCKLFEIVRERHPEVAGRVVFTTGNLDNPVLSRFLRDTGAPLLRKPFQIEEIGAAFQRLGSIRS